MNDIHLPVFQFLLGLNNLSKILSGKTWIQTWFPDLLHHVEAAQFVIRRAKS